MTPSPLDLTAFFTISLSLSSIPFITTHNTALSVKENLNEFTRPIAKVHTFKDLIEHSNVFVDKTLLLAEFLHGYTHIALIPSPVSWGKSVILDMIKMFVEIRADDRGRELPRQDQPYYKFFKYGQITWTPIPQQLRSPPLIAQHDALIEKYQGRFPVIHLNMRQMIGRSFNEIFYKFAKLVSLKFREYSFIRDYLYVRMNNVTRNRKVRDEAFQRYTTFNYFVDNVKPHKPRLREGIRFLIDVLHWYYEKRVYVFVDDYDAPFNCLLHQLPPQEVNKLALFFQRFYAQTLKSPHLKKAILTGLFPINRNASLMPYNVRTHTYMKHRFCEYFGFTQPIVDDLFQLLGMQNWSSAARHWYNGYLTEGNLSVHVYNPSSLIEFIDQCQLRIYTKPASDRFDMLETMIRVKPFRHTFEQLINNKSVPIHADQLFLEPKSFAAFRRLFDADFNYMLPTTVVAPAFGYLASAGYLTAEDLEYHPWVGLRILQIKIPNYEMMHLIAKKLIDRYLDENEIYPELVERIADRLAYFAQNNRTKSPPLKDSFDELFHLLDLNLNKDTNRVQYVGQILLSMLNLISLKLRLDYRFETQVNDESNKPDVILSKDHYAAAIILRYDVDTADNLLETVKQYKSIFHNRQPPIKTVKFIGIEITSERDVRLRAQLQNVIE